MATFECKVYELTIKEHPNADALELARVGDYISIVGKGQFKTGDLGVYIPEAAVVPEWLLKEIGLDGKLAGKAKNRVKAMKLRGVISQGLIYPINNSDAVPHISFDASEITPMTPYGCLPVKEGDDVTELLGITKYEPPIPSSMSGEVFNAFGKTISFDIENIKKHPNVLEEGEEITITEKLHGTWCCFGYHPEVDCPIVTSKGLSGRGLAFKFNEANGKNLYMQMFDKLTKQGEGINIVEQLWHVGVSEAFHEAVYILGEVYGKGVQDLAYVDDNEKHFRVFDIYVGEPKKGHYLHPADVANICSVLNIETVPWLYVGPYSKEVVEEFTNGKETVSGKELHIREGVVIRPEVERRHDHIGRVILKSVSDAYLLRKNATEFN